jgi:Tfp pilus assembly protein PilF
MLNNFFDRLIKTDARVLLGIGLCVLAAYSVMLSSPFKTLDDDFSIVRNTEIQDLRSIPGFFHSTYFKSQHDYYRPLVYVTYALEYHWFGLSYFYYNLDNVMFHILNTWLVFALAATLLPTRRQAFMVALLFGIHPLHWEAVGNVSGRSILLCTFFVLCGLNAFVRYARSGRIAWLAGAAACYALGLMAKESAGVFLLTAVAFRVLISKTRSRGHFWEWSWLAPFMILAGGYFWLRHILGIVKVFPWPNIGWMMLGVMTFLKGVLIYIRLLIFPVGLRFDRALPLFGDILEPGLWVTLTVWLTAVYLFVKVRSRLPALAKFCLAWFAIELMPVSQIVTSIGVHPGTISLAEHFVYLASVPALILMVTTAVWLINQAAERKLVSRAVLTGAMAGVVAFFFILLVQQNIYASNEFVMLRDSLEKQPSNARLQYSMGLIYVRARNYPKALEHFRAAAAIDGQNRTYRTALGKALSDNGDNLAAARAYESIPPLKEGADDLLEGNKTAVYRLLVAEFEAKVAALPENAENRFSLGVFRSKLGMHAQAATDFAEAFRIDPNRYDALFNLAVTYEALGAWDQSRDVYTQLAGKVNPFQNSARQRLPYIEARKAGQ